MTKSTFPDNWKILRLDEIGNIVTGSTPPTKNPEYYSSNDICFFKPDDLNENTLNSLYESNSHLSITGASKSRMLPAGSVLVTCIGIIGKVGVLKNDACFNQQINGIKVDTRIANPIFVGYSLLYNNYILKAMANAPVVPIINKSQFSTISIPIPPMEMQNNIVSILKKVEKAIENRKEADELTDKYLQSVFLEMFGDPVINPKGWKKKKIKELGKVTTGNTPSRDNPQYYGDFIEWIKSDNINTPFHYLTRAVEFLSEEGMRVGRTVPESSILVTCIAGSRSCIGNAALAARKVAFNQQINAITPYEGINSYFLYTQILVAKSLIQAASTNSMKGLVSKGAFEEIELICPPSSQQLRFGKIFEYINKIKDKQREAANEIDSLYRSLMEKVFKGELL